MKTLPLLHEFYQEQGFNPTTFDVSSGDRLLLHRQKRDNLYVRKLGIPSGFWKGARVLEVGCSSGENTLLLAQDGAELDIVEPLRSSVDRLRRLFHHYGLEQRLHRTHIQPVQEVSFDEPYDAIIAEGFLYALADRDEVLRRLFEALAPGGLLIVSTLDPVGNFLETMRAAVAQLFCRRHGVRTLDEQAAAVEPFFREDFESIPHTRAFTQWAKDSLLNPLMTTGRCCYGFDEIAAVLRRYADCRYYSSWPSYRHANDLLWHKHVESPAAAWKACLDAYCIRRPSYLLGEVREEPEAMRFLLDNPSDLLIAAIREIYRAVRQELHEGQTGRVRCVFADLPVQFEAAAEVFRQVERNVTELDARVYRESILLRRHWGVPYHYVVLNKMGNSNE